MKRDDLVTIRLELTDTHMDKTVDIEVSLDSALALTSLYQSEDDYAWCITDIRLAPDLEPTLVSVDADHRGHLLTVITDYVNQQRMNVEDFLESDDTDSRFTRTLDFADLHYLAGNIQGRLLSPDGPITDKDLELLEAWEAELN